MYKCRNFDIKELVSSAMYDEYKTNPNKLWLLFDDRILRVADAMRDQFGVCYVNNWHIGGTLNYCGFREANSGVGAMMSQHRYGRALDLHFANHTAEEIRKCIMANSPALIEFKFIKGVEKDVSWVHIDTRNSKDCVWFKA